MILTFLKVYGLCVFIEILHILIMIVLQYTGSQVYGMPFIPDLRMQTMLAGVAWLGAYAEHDSQK